MTTAVQFDDGDTIADPKKGCRFEREKKRERERETRNAEFRRGRREGNGEW